MHGGLVAIILPLKCIDIQNKVTMDISNIPSVHDVFSFINNLLLVKRSQYYGKTEHEVENIIVKQLREQYGEMNVHRQYSVGGFLGLKCDIDLFDSKCCGIELKLAKQLAISSSAKERLIGQAVYYSKRCYQKRLIILIIGTKKEYNTSLKEIQDFLEELGVFFIYKVVE